MAISDYSTTAASNTAISGISLAENVMVPSDVNNAIRQMMADIKAGVPYLSGTTYLIESTDAGATAGPDFATYRNSASPAASDLIGRYLFQGEDSAGNTETYAAIAGRISDPTSTSEDAALLIQAALAGTLTTYMYVGANAAGTATANAVGLPLGQLSFPATQNASSDAHTLDDYEEGQTNPSITASTGTFTSVSCTLDYVKVGKHVSCSFSITVTTNGTAAGVIKLPLPFAATAARYGGGGYSSGGHGLAISPFDASTAAITKYDGTYGAATGQTLYGSFTYVAAN